ncbi:autophagy-related protein 101-like [Glandiceps talaboti]
MNARSQLFELSVEGRQIEEVVLSIFHTLLFHRTTGKFHYKREGTYSIGTVGILDVDCDFIDFTYVRCTSDELDAALKREISTFKDALRNSEGPLTGQISLEFYQRKKTRWPFPAESIPWEVWTLKLNVITLTNEHERQICREKVGERLGEKIICITEAMNRNEYLPKMPNQSDLDCVFDTTYSDVQPYLYKVSHMTSGPPNASVSSTMRKLIRDTLAL